MKPIFIIALLVFMQLSYAEELSFSEKIRKPGGLFGYMADFSYAETMHAAFQKCPQGFEQKRIWVTNSEQGALFHLTIDCFEPQTTPSKP